jgi:DNA-binding helix-hairpin-helix protein with protein kinase domain
MSDVMRRVVEPRFRALTTAGLHLAHNFLLLHAQGLCYRDISFGNVALDPDTGDVVIADNDNVAVDGVGAVGLLGTPRFMAPEIVWGEAVPGTQTDLFSLAVLLFYLFVMHHPLEGRRERALSAMDLPAMTRLYGAEPVFVFDPDDDSNRPVPGEHANAIAFWPQYPELLRRLFTRAFTVGIRDPRDGRVREGEWRAAMVAVRDLIIYCGTCGAESFAERGGGPVRPSCWCCGAALAAPMHLAVGRSIVMLNHDALLTPHHLEPARRFDFARPAAEMSANPANPGVWGLRNLSERPWRAGTPAGSVYEIQPGQSIRLQAGVTIDFGESEGRVGINRISEGESAVTAAAAPWGDDGR